MHFPFNNLAFIFIIRIIKNDWSDGFFLTCKLFRARSSEKLDLLFLFAGIKGIMSAYSYFGFFFCFFQLHFILLFKCFLCCLQETKKITTIIFSETNRGSEEVQMKSYICKGRIEKQFTLIQSRVSLLDYRLIVFTNTLPRGF